MTDGQSRPRKPNLFARVMSSVTSTPEMVAWPHTIRRLVERQSGLEYPCARTSGREEACFLTLSEKADREDERGGAESYWNSGRWWSVCTRHEDSHRKRSGLPSSGEKRRETGFEMKGYAMAKNTICLWYDKDAEAAARLYAETFPNSTVGA